MAGGYHGDDASGGAYGYGAYGSPPPGGYLDAAADLYGPGSHAYLSAPSGFGSVYTSYAYESQRGGIFEQNTTSSNFAVTQSTTYSYHGDGYSSFVDTDTFSPLQPVRLNGYSYGYYGGSSIPNHLETYGYSSFVSTSYQSGGYTHLHETIFSLTDYTDGSAVSHYTSIDQVEDSGGHLLAGSQQIYTVAGFDYGNGYTAYIPG